jgi:DNA repair exonuclease SbcCD ATPase subunit
MIAGAGLVSFAAAFVFGWFTAPKAAPEGQSSEADRSTITGMELDFKLPQPETDTTGALNAGNDKMKRAMTVKQLKTLVYEVRAKIDEYEAKLKSLGVQEQRLQMAHSMVKKDIEKLDNLRVELASTVTSLKEQQDKLRKDTEKIAEAEKANLVTIAATYDKMDAARASEILINMSQMQSDEHKASTSSLDDVVKILHYMTERTKAKLLAELASSKPKLAAVLCQRLKWVIEEE